MKRILVAVFSLSWLVAQQGFAKEAKAIIHDTTDAAKIYGEMMLVDSPEGLKIEGTLSNVPAGKHGFHIHEYGSCDEKGNAAGSHYNPKKVDHGLLSKDGMGKAHLGDMGNVEIAADGTGKISHVLSGVTLSGGDHNVEGRTIILHEKEDDFGQPTGNAGGRVGCGLITFIAPEAVTAQAAPVPAPVAETPAPTATPAPAAVTTAPAATSESVPPAPTPAKETSGTTTTTTVP